jgi:HlyD family secretion protein
VEQASVSLDQARAQLNDAVLGAPFAGTILAVNVSQGEWATPGTPAIVLAATETLVLEVNVDELDVALLAEGQPSYLRFDALKDQEAGGTVRSIAPSSTNVSGAVAYGVEVGFERGQLPIRLGMTADVEIVIARVGDALLVPNRAIEADRAAGRYYVTRQNALGSEERIEVRIGLRDGDHTQIVEGLSEGDRLVLPTVPSQTSEDGPSMPFGGGGRQMGGMGGGN